jgi:hypothetical protein
MLSNPKKGNKIHRSNSKPMFSDVILREGDYELSRWKM